MTAESGSRSLKGAGSIDVGRPDKPASFLTAIAEKIVRYGLPVVILCLPLEFTSTLIRQPLSRVVLVVVAVAFAYLVADRRRDLIVPREASVIPLGVYVVVSVVDWALTRAPGSRNAVLDITLYPAVGLLILNLVRSEKAHREAWIAFQVSGLAIALLGAVLYVTHTTIWTPNAAVVSRMNITFADPNITARFLTLAACAAVLMFAARKGPSWLSLVTGVACAAVLPLTFSRSGLGLLIVSVVLAVALTVEHRRAAVIGGVVLLAFAISVAANPDTRLRAIYAESAVEVTVKEILHIGSQGTSGQSSGQGSAQGQTSGGIVAIQDDRRYLIAAGLRMFRDHPIAGVGFGGFQHALLTTYKSYLPANYQDSVSHTSLVTLVAEQGVIGLLLVLAFLFLLARETWRSRRKRGPWTVWVTLPAILIIPIFMYSQFEGRFFPEPYLWLMLGLLYSARHLENGDPAAHLSDGSGSPTALVAPSDHDGRELAEPVGSTPGHGSESS